MKDIPNSAIKWYKMWINAFPESWHPNDLERFYMFIHVLLSNVKKDRSRFWLKNNLEHDCPKLSKQDIEKYCDIYESKKYGINIIDNPWPTKKLTQQTDIF